MSRLFDLVRHTDVSGVSGTGTVATGVEFEPGGKTVIRWHGDTPSTVVWDSLDDAMKVHGHNGATVVRWHDESPAETPLHRVADAIAGGLPYTRVDKGYSDQVEIHTMDEAEWRQWLAALGPHNAADASVYVDRGTAQYPQQREWTTPDGGIKVFYLVPAGGEDQ